MNADQHREVRKLIADPQTIPLMWRPAFKVPLIVAFAWVPLLWLILFPHGLLAAGALSVWSGVGINLALMNVGHDGLHNPLFRSQWLSAAVVWMLSYGNSRQWWIAKHNLAHHNGVPGSKNHEPPINLGPALRLAPDQPWRRWHRAQIVYFWPIVTTQHLSMMLSSTVFSVTGTFMGKQIAARDGLSVARRLLAQWLLPVVLILVASRQHSWGSIALSSLVMALVAGTLASAVLLVEVVERATIANTALAGWADYQLSASMSIGRSSAWLTWLTGSINLHNSHHLFPTLPAWRLPQVDHALHQVVAANNLKINDYSSYPQSWLVFARFLADLGKRPKAVIPASPAGACGVVA